MAIKVVTNHRCERCGGTLVVDYDKIYCLLCGAEHDKYGNLILPRDSIAEKLKPVMVPHHDLGIKSKGQV